MKDNKMKEHKDIARRDPQLIVVFGLPGSGKSTFARELACAIDARIINSDMIRGEILLRGNYSEKAKERVYSEMLKMAVAKIEHGESVILDGTYYKEKLRRKVEKKAQELHLIPHFIEVKADEEVIRQRVSRRREDSDADYDVYLNIRSQFEPLCSYHLIVHSDSQTPEEMLTKALLFIGIYHEAMGN
ncbi:MAG: AAA family ATPase [Bacteroidetes bacterium]|jgi:predicted kinase|nr:AAA family ATPase [Bacteroidota bacterium]